MFRDNVISYKGCSRLISILKDHKLAMINYIKFTRVPSNPSTIEGPNLYFIINRNHDMSILRLFFSFFEYIYFSSIMDLIDK